MAPIATRMKPTAFVRLSAAFLAGAALTWLLMRGMAPTRNDAGDHHHGPPGRPADPALALLDGGVSGNTYDFAMIAEGCSGRRVVPLDDRESHRRVVAAIHQALGDCLRTLNRGDSPVRSLRRINEASRFFEEGLMERLNALPGIECSIPPTRSGVHQRAGYPDLRIADKATGDIFYLDPKLVERGSERSTLRTFYFEPKNETLKITDDAVHLLAGIEHDGNEGRWTFTGWRLVDLSTLRVRLKAEFQASNAELYDKSVLSTPAGDD